MKPSAKPQAPGVTPLTSPALLTHKSVRHGFFTRSGGVSTGTYASLNCGYGSGDDKDCVAQNRAMVAAQLGVDAHALCTAYQIHSAKAVTIQSPWQWQQAPEADAIVTSEPGIALGILTADCVPVLFADSKHHVIGAAHAGWKGAIGGVLEATLDAMLKLGAQAADITAAIGPAIAQGSYEVGAEFHERFVQADENHRMYFIHSSREGHYMFDLKAYVKDRLRNAGIRQIDMLAHDTCQEEDLFFSFRRATLRREAVYGRQVSAISLTS